MESEGESMGSLAERKVGRDLRRETDTMPIRAARVEGAYRWAHAYGAESASAGLAEPYRGPSAGTAADLGRDHRRLTDLLAPIAPSV